MKRIWVLLLIILIFAIQATGCNSSGAKNSEQASEKEIIAARPSVLDMGRGKLTSLPSYDRYVTGFLQIDLRSHDLSSIYLKNRFDDLINADFDNKTIWPYGLPKNFDPKEIMKNGKDPGLQIRELHKNGITGRGVGIAVIGDTLLIDHAEYGDRLRYYKEIDKTEGPASISGCAVASVAAGKTVGVAPGSDLYYIVNTDNSKVAGDDSINNEKNGIAGMYQYSSIAASIDRVIGINHELPEDRKIRVICIGFELKNDDGYYNSIAEVVNKASENGIFVISNLLYETYNYKYDFNGLGRNPLADPNVFSSYEPGSWWKNTFFMFERYSRTNEALLVPTDSRCTASPTGSDDYAYYSNGLKSFSYAYIAGLYALACQVKPDITPGEFWDIALRTGETIEIINKNIDYNYKLKKVVNPVKLIEKIQR